MGDATMIMSIFQVVSGDKTTYIINNMAVILLKSNQSKFFPLKTLRHAVCQRHEDTDRRTPLWKQVCNLHFSIWGGFISLLLQWRSCTLDSLQCHQRLSCSPSLSQRSLVCFNAPLNTRADNVSQIWNPSPPLWDSQRLTNLREDTPPAIIEAYHLEPISYHPTSQVNTVLRSVLPSSTLWGRARRAGRRDDTLCVSLSIFKLKTKLKKLSVGQGN